MKIKSRGRSMTIKFTGNEGRRLAKHINAGGSLGDIMVPKIPASVKKIELTAPLELNEERLVCEICKGSGGGNNDPCSNCRGLGYLI